MKRRPTIVKPDEPFTNAIDGLQTLVIALGGGLCVWGGCNLLDGYGRENPFFQCGCVIKKHNKQN